MSKLSKKIISMLKSNTYNSVYLNTLAKLPIVVTGEGTFINSIEVNGDVYPINNQTKEEYLDELQLIVHDIIQSDYNPESVAYLRTIIVEWLSRKCRLINVKKFHYDDTWYAHRYSVDYPEETFGILKVDNLPFRKLDKLMNKKSFICRMDQLIFNDLMQPLMLFINRKFVNWNAIDIVFDCDEAYLLLHGTEYNTYNLDHAEMHMVILPFKTEFIGEESDDIWFKNYEMLRNYMQDTLHINENNKIEISVPTMYSIYKYRGMVYNVGSWLYTQLRMIHLGLLSDDRISKLKRIILNKYTYDESGNLISTYSTKFNALDKDTYDISTYEYICHCSLDYLKDHVMFKFDSNGMIDMDNGTNLLSNLDDSMTIISKESSESNIVMNYSYIDETLFRENYIVFKSGLFYPECKINMFGENVSSIENLNNEKYVIKTFNPSMIENMIYLNDSFINKEYFNNKTYNFAKSAKEDQTTKKLLSLAGEYLNYSYFDNLLYDDNFKQAFNAVMEFNPLLLNDLTKTTIKSTVISGKTANESLTFPLGKENRKGLKIPRYKYSDHETYVMVFLNGELISNYSEMYVASNYFFLPINDNFANGDVIEFLFFTYCDNNEIHFRMTDNMLSKMPNSEDPSFVESNLFSEYIKSEDIKIFAKYPKEIMIYKDLIDEKNDIAFNISYRDSSSNLLLFKDVVNNKDNEFTAVSSRKFIYERLYVDQKAYRIKLHERFRYCDNQKQYILFINGRRMEDESFFITVPKYSRPFWGIYLYITKFVNPTDRIEIFYVPEELYNINTDYESMVFDETGYIKANKNDLDVPYNDKFYLYFVNGKKIPNADVVPIDSHTVRLKSDTKTLLKLNVNPIYRSTDNAITAYMHGSKLSKYDSLIEYIKNTDGLGYKELDSLFGTYIKMSNIEQDKIKWNVDRIAIINEIVRDFWVTSGFRYNEQPFVYDYALDEIIQKDPRNGNYILPALDANPLINILKNDIRLLYFNINKDTTVFEIGSKVWDFNFEWEFTNPVGQATVVLVSQYINGVRIDNIARSYNFYGPVSEDKSFYFQFNTMQATIDKQVDIKFCNGIYYGVVDEDMLQCYGKKSYFLISDIIAVVPKDKVIPSSAEQALESETLDVVRKDNHIMTNIAAVNESFYSNDDAVIWPKGTINIEDDNLIAICENGRIFRNVKIVDAYTALGEYLDEGDLPELMKTLNRVYQDTPTLNFDKYKIGSNNYFVYAAPKRLAFDANGKSLIRFVMPDLNDKDLIGYGKDDHTTPIYTDGYWDEQNCLNKLDECKMVYMGEFEYTNPSGYTEPYVIWKTNGFFTRKYDDYEFDMKIVSENDFVDVEEIPIEITDTESTKSFRAVNTASPSGSDVNDNIVFIDALIL